MLTLELGYPLYTPTLSTTYPMAYRKKGIRVGDVGVISSHGAFHFLFNACRHHEQPGEPINPAILPQGFELLESNIICHVGSYPRTHLLSNHVEACDSSDS